MSLLSNSLLTSRASRRRLLGALLAAAGGMIRAAMAGDEVEAPREYQVKAAFIYNFTKFITWPENRPGASPKIFVVGILGKSPFEGELEKISRGRSVAGKTLIVRYLDTIADATSLDLLFVKAGEEAKLGNDLGSLHDACVLTVGETPRFAELGGIITFSKSADKIRFEINRNSGLRARLKISPQLLKLAVSARSKEL